MADDTHKSISIGVSIDRASRILKQIAEKSEAVKQEDRRKLALLEKENQARQQSSKVSKHAQAYGGR